MVDLLFRKTLFWLLLPDWRVEIPHVLPPLGQQKDVEICKNGQNIKISIIVHATYTELESVLYARIFLSGLSIDS